MKRPTFKLDEDLDVRAANVLRLIDEVVVALQEYNPSGALWIVEPNHIRFQGGEEAT